MTDEDDPKLPYWARLHPADLKRIGCTPAKWERFVGALLALDDTTVAFHGTSSQRLITIAEQGLVGHLSRTGLDRNDKTEVLGCCFGTAAIALYHAIYRFRQDGTRPVIIGAIIEDLAEGRTLFPDQAAIELPFENLIGRTYREVSEAWSSSNDPKDWQASFEIAGSFVVLGDVSPGLWHPLLSAGDIRVFRGQAEGRYSACGPAF